MNMQRERIPVSTLEAGDIVRQVFTDDSRTVVISQAFTDLLAYHGEDHVVTRVIALDLEKNKRVTWLAVPDQHVTVIR